MTGKLARLVEAAPNALAGAAALFDTPSQPAEAGPASAPAPTAVPDAAVATAAMPAAAAPAAETQKKRSNGIDYEEDGVDNWVEVMRQAADEFTRLKHLTLWSKQQRERWFTLPNPNVSTGKLCPQPNMSVINRDYIAAGT